MIDRRPALIQTSGNRKRPALVSSTCVNQKMQIFAAMASLQNIVAVQWNSSDVSRVRKFVVCVKIPWQWKTEVENKFYVNRQTSFSNENL
ncbi:hypothetical protein T4C_12196 [Trichinella pseudospiralis]|uniref:Uncharacterized protein n=1 Tax=Trichinella pseudospiralis TaxID=6337 RepID=A0A0V1JNZ1_TRIPS|nr:hypothetical protein T4C_12196 [Trichinella pseudospiralis]